MLLKTFATSRHHYIYTAWTNQIARVDEPTWEYFRCGCDRGRRDSTLRRQVEHRAQKLGLLPSPLPRHRTFPASHIRERLSELAKRGPAMVVLGLTEQCNFRCLYCVYSGAYRDSRSHSPRVMSEETLRRALDWYLSFDRDEHKIGFYGGEPLLRFPTIRAAVGYASEHKAPTTRLEFAVTTNGSLLRDEVCDFLADHEFDLYISLDGPQEVHDRYRVDLRRRPTFERVWNRVERLQRRHPEYFARCVGFNVTAAPPDRLSEVASFLADQPQVFASKVPLLSPLADGDSEVYEHMGVGEKERQISYAGAVRSFLASCEGGEVPSGWDRACCEKIFATLHRRSMEKLEDPVASRGQCIPGRRCFVSVDGRLHMCEHTNEKFPIGSVLEGLDRAVITRRLRQFAELVDRHCAGCWAIRFCSKCIPMIARGESLSRRRLTALCRRSRRNLTSALAAYCETRDKNERCFDWMVS